MTRKTVWISRIMEDTTLMKSFVSDVSEADPDEAVATMRANDPARFKERSMKDEGRVIELSVECGLPKPAPLPGLGGTPYAAPPSPKSKRPAFGKRWRS